MTNRLRRQRRRWFAWLIVVLAAIFILHSAGSTLVVTASLDNPDSIVMLASHEWERLPATAAVARRYPGAVVLLTIPQSPSYWNCFRCSERVEWLSRQGVDRTRISELEGAANTYGEARIVATFLETHALKRLLIVTSPYHARRSLMTFRSVLTATGVDVGLEPADDYSNQTPESWWRYDVDRAYVGYEWAAIAWYTARYGVRPF